MTAYGYTTSSQDTPKTLNLEDAPFWKYLEILEKEGYKEDAEASKLFYVELLKEFDFTEEQVMKTSFKNLTIAVEKIINQASEEMKTSMNLPTMSGPVITGAGADELNEEQLQYLLRRQLQLHEEEKLRQGM